MANNNTESAGPRKISASEIQKKINEKAKNGTLYDPYFQNTIQNRITYDDLGQYADIARRNNWDLNNISLDETDLQRRAYQDQTYWERLKIAGKNFGGLVKSGAKGMWREGRVVSLLSDRLTDWDYEPQYEKEDTTEPIFSSPDKGKYQHSYWLNQFSQMGTSVGMLAGMAPEMLGEQFILSGLTGGTGIVEGIGKMAAKWRKVKKGLNAAKVGEQAIETAAKAGTSYSKAAWRTNQALNKVGQVLIGVDQGEKNSRLNEQFNMNEVFTQEINSMAEQLSKEEGIGFEEAVEKVLANENAYNIAYEKSKAAGEEQYALEAPVDMLINGIQGYLNVAPFLKMGSLTSTLVGKTMKRTLIKDLLLHWGGSGILEMGEEAWEEMATLYGQTHYNDENNETKTFLGIGEESESRLGEFVGDFGKLWAGNEDRIIDNAIGGLLGGLILGPAQSGIYKLANIRSDKRRKEALKKNLDNLEKFKGGFAEFYKKNLEVMQARTKLEEYRSKLPKNPSEAENEKLVNMVNDVIALENSAQKNQLLDLKIAAARYDELTQTKGKGSKNIFQDINNEFINVKNALDVYGNALASNPNLTDDIKNGNANEQVRNAAEILKNNGILSDSYTLVSSLEDSKKHVQAMLNESIMMDRDLAEGFFGIYMNMDDAVDYMITRSYQRQMQTLIDTYSNISDNIVGAMQQSVADKFGEGISKMNTADLSKAISSILRAMTGEDVKTDNTHLKDAIESVRSSLDEYRTIKSEDERLFNMLRTRGIKRGVAITEPSLVNEMQERYGELEKEYTTAENNLAEILKNPDSTEEQKLEALAKLNSIKSEMSEYSNEEDLTKQDATKQIAEMNKQMLELIKKAYDKAEKVSKKTQSIIAKLSNINHENIEDKSVMISNVISELEQLRDSQKTYDDASRISEIIDILRDAKRVADDIVSVDNVSSSLKANKSKGQYVWESLKNSDNELLRFMSEVKYGSQLDLTYLEMAQTQIDILREKNEQLENQINNIGKKSVRNIQKKYARLIAKPDAISDDQIQFFIDKYNELISEIDNSKDSIKNSHNMILIKQDLMNKKAKLESKLNGNTTVSSNRISSLNPNEFLSENSSNEGVPVSSLGPTLLTQEELESNARALRKLNEKKGIVYPDSQTQTTEEKPSDNSRMETLVRDILARHSERALGDLMIEYFDKKEYSQEEVMNAFTAVNIFKQYGILDIVPKKQGGTIGQAIDLIFNKIDVAVLKDKNLPFIKYLKAVLDVYGFGNESNLLSAMIYSENYLDDKKTEHSETDTGVVVDTLGEGENPVEDKGRVEKVPTRESQVDELKSDNNPDIFQMPYAIKNVDGTYSYASRIQSGDKSAIDKKAFDALYNPSRIKKAYLRGFVGSLEENQDVFKKYLDYLTSLHVPAELSKKGKETTFLRNRLQKDNLLDYNTNEESLRKIWENRNSILSDSPIPIYAELKGESEPVVIGFIATSDYYNESNVSALKGNEEQQKIIASLNKFSNDVRILLSSYNDIELKLGERPVVPQDINYLEINDTDFSNGELVQLGDNYEELAYITNGINIRTKRIGSIHGNFIDSVMFSGIYKIKEELVNGKSVYIPYKLFVNGNTVFADGKLLNVGPIYMPNDFKLEEKAPEIFQHFRNNIVDYVFKNFLNKMHKAYMNANTSERKSLKNDIRTFLEKYKDLLFIDNIENASANVINLISSQTYTDFNCKLDTEFKAEQPRAWLVDFSSDEYKKQVNDGVNYCVFHYNKTKNNELNFFLGIQDENIKRRRENGENVHDTRNIVNTSVLNTVEDYTNLFEFIRDKFNNNGDAQKIAVMFKDYRGNTSLDKPNDFTKKVFSDETIVRDLNMLKDGKVLVNENVENAKTFAQWFSENAKETVGLIDVEMDEELKHAPYQGKTIFVEENYEYGIGQKSIVKPVEIKKESVPEQSKKTNSIEIPAAHSIRKGRSLNIPTRIIISKRRTSLNENISDESIVSGMTLSEQREFCKSLFAEVIENNENGILKKIKNKEISHNAIVREAYNLLKNAFEFNGIFNSIIDKAEYYINESQALVDIYEGKEKSSNDSVYIETYKKYQNVFNKENGYEKEYNSHKINIEDNKNALSNLESMQQECLEKLFHIPSMQDDKFWVGTFIEYVNSLNKGNISIDEVSEEQMQKEQDKTTASDFDYETESFEKEPVGDFSFYLKSILSDIPKTQRDENGDIISVWQNQNELLQEGIDEYEDVNKIIRILGNVIVNSQCDWNDVLRNLVELANDDSYEYTDICKMLYFKLSDDNIMPDQYKKEIMSKMSLSYHDMMYIKSTYDKNGDIVLSLNNVSDNKKYAQELSKIKEHLKSNKNIIKNGKFNREFLVENIVNLDAFIDKFEKGQQYSVSEAKKSMSNLFGVSFSTNTIKANMENLKRINDSLRTFVKNTDNNNEWDHILGWDGSTSRIYEIADLNSAIKELVIFECNESGNTIEKTETIAGKKIMTTYQRPLREKQFKDMQDKTGFYDVIMSIFRTNDNGNYYYRYFQLDNIDVMPLKTGLSSLSMLDMFGKRSSRMVEMPDSDQTVAECILNQETLGTVSENKEHKLVGFTGNYVESFKTRTGYQFSYTVSDKNRLPWIRMQKYVIPVTSYKGKTNTEFYTIDFSKMLPFVTKQLLDNELLTIENDLKCDLTNNIGKHLILSMPELNNIVIEFDGKKRTLESLLSSCNGADEEYINRAFDSLRQQYDDMFRQARPIVLSVIEQEVAKLVLNKGTARGVENGIRIFNVDGSIPDDIKKGMLHSSWHDAGIFDYNDEHEDYSATPKYYKKDYDKYVIDKAADNKKASGYGIFNVIYSAYDMVVNTLLSSGMMQNCFYSPLTRFAKVNRQTVGKLMEIETRMFDEAGNVNSLVAKEKLDLIKRISKKASKNLNKRMGGIDGSGRMLDFSNITHYNDKMWGGENHNEYLYLCVGETVSPSAIYENILRQQYPNNDELDELIRQSKDESLTQSERADALNIIKSKYPKANSYLNIDSTDGAEWISWRECIDIQLAHADISDETRKRLEYMYDKFSQGIFDDDDAQYLLKVMDKNLMNIAFNPDKPMYCGVMPVYDKDGNIKTTQMTYVKSASIPLLPQFTRNTPIDYIRKAVEFFEQSQRKNVRLSFDSGIKVGNMSSDKILSFDDLVDIGKQISEDGELSIYKEIGNGVSSDMNTSHAIVLQTTDNKKIDIFNSILYRLKMSSINADRKYFHIQMETESHREEIVLRKEDYGYDNFVDYFTNTKGFIVSKRDVLDLRGRLRRLGIYDKLTVAEQDMLALRDMDIDHVLDKDQREMFDKFIESDRLNKLYHEMKMDDIGRILDNGQTYVVESTQLDHVLESAGINNETRRIFEIPQRQLDKAIEDGIISESDITDGKVDGKKFEAIRFNMTQKRVIREETDFLNELGIESVDDMNLKNQNFIRNLSKMIAEELLSRGYSTNMVEQMGLVETSNNGNMQFKIPPFLHASSEKISVLISALIRNRISKNRLPGNALYTASNEGFVKLKGADHTFDSRSVVWIDKEAAKRGTLGAVVENGELKLAEVAIAPQFNYRDERGVLRKIDLYSVDKKTGKSIYLVNEKGESLYIKDGKIISDYENIFLNESMFDEEMIKMMTFRIPLSGHQSACAVKIVAFLPPAMGDMIIVPKEHLKQLGEDFDIDKRFCYIKNYMVDKDNKVRVLTKDFVDRKIRESNEYKRLYKMVNDDIFNGNGAVEDIDTFIWNEGMYYDKGASLYRYLSFVKDRLERKLDENDTISMYQSVFENPDITIQKQISKVLNFDVLEETRDEVIDKKDTGADDSFITPYSTSYQKELRLGNANAKKGVGVWSSALVVSGLIQKRNVELEKVGYLGTISPVLLRFDGNTFDGSLSRTTTLDQQNTKTDVISAQQNANVDNAKADVVSLSNQNSVTFNFYTFMAQMGFNKTSMVETVNGEKKQLDLAYLVALQPSVLKYTRLKQANQSIIGRKRSEKSILFDVLSDYGMSEDNVRKIMNGVSVNGLNFDGVMFDVGSTYFDGITGQYLYDTLNKEYDSSEKQLKTFVFFYNIMKYGGFLQQYSKLLNVTSQGIGNTYFDVLEHVEALNSLGSQKTFKGLGDLIGKFYKLDDDNIPDNAMYIDGCNYAIVPTTNEGVVLLHTLSMTSKMFNSIYNIGSSKVSSIYSDLNTFARAAYLPSNELDQINKDISRAIKQYVYKLLGDENIKAICNTKGLFDGTLEEETDRLLNPSFNRYALNRNSDYLAAIDRFNNDVKEDKVISDEKVSLGYIINFLSDANHPLMESNRFLNALSVTKDGALMFKPNANEIANKDYHRHFFDLYNNTDVITVNGNDIVVNGEKLTYRALAQDLATYAYLCHDENGILNLREYIPIEYLDLCGVPTMLRHISDNMDTYISNGNFISQFQLSYPEIIRNVNITRDNDKYIATEGSVSDFDNVKSFTINYSAVDVASSEAEAFAIAVDQLDIADPRYVEYVKPLEYVKIRGKKNENIFKYNPDTMTYNRVYKETNFGANELNPYENGLIVSTQTIVEPSNVDWVSTNDKDKIYELVNTHIDHDNNMTKFILPVLDMMRGNDNYELNIIVDNTKIDFNTETEIKDGKLVTTIRINSNYINSDTLMEELMHMVQQQEIARVFVIETIDGVSNVVGYKNPSDKGYFGKSYDLFLEFSTWWQTNGQRFSQRHKALINQFAYDKQIVADANNFFEFMAAGASLNPVFDEALREFEIDRNKQKKSSIKQIIMSMKNAIKAFINKLFKGTKSNVTRTIVGETIDYIDNKFFDGQMSDLQKSENILLKGLKDIMSDMNKRAKMDAIVNSIERIKNENKDIMDENHNYTKDGRTNFVSSSSLFDFLYKIGVKGQNAKQAASSGNIESNTSLRRGNMYDAMLRDMFKSMMNKDFNYDNELSKFRSDIDKYNAMLDKNVDKEYFIDENVIEYMFRSVYDITHDMNGDLNGYFISDEVRMVSDAEIMLNDIDTKMSLAGTPDLIFVSNDGQIHIIDFKNTIRDQIGNDYVDGQRLTTNRLQNTYPFQLKGYGIMLKEALGLNDEFKLNYHIMEINGNNVLTTFNMNDNVERIPVRIDGNKIVFSIPSPNYLDRIEMTEFDFEQNGSVVESTTRQDKSFPNLC